MNATLHVLKKDLHHFRPHLILFYLLALGCWLGYATGDVSPELGLTLNFGLGGAILVLIYLALNSDSVAESTAWWRTRPIASTEILRAKLGLWLIAVTLPLCLAVTALALRYRFSTGQLILANIEVCLATAAILGLLATWLSIPGLKANVGINIGATFFFFVILIFFSLGSLPQHNHLPRTAETLGGSSLSLGLLALALGTCSAWAFLACFRRPMEAMLSFIAAIVIFFGSGVAAAKGRNLAFDLSPSDNERIQMNLLDQPHSPAADEAHAYLYNHFRLTGLKSREFAALAYLKGTFRWPDGAISQMSDVDGAPGGNSSHNLDRRVMSQLRPVLLSEYPRETAWTSDGSRLRQNFFPISLPDKSYQIRTDTIGDLQGTIMANVLKLVPQGKFPLRKGIYRMAPGRSLEIEDPSFHWDAIKLEFYLTRPKLALSSNPESNLTSPYTQEHTRYFFVIYHPEQEEAFLLSQNHIRLRSVKTIVPANKKSLSINIPFSSLRSAINGLSMDDWIQGAEIHPYKIEIIGIKKHEFAAKNYRIYRDQHLNDAAPLTLDRLTLSEDADDAQVRQYLIEVLANIPDRYSNAAIQQIRSKVAEIRPEHLPILLSLLPDSEGIVNTYLNRTITQLVRPEHRDEFAKLWETRDDLIYLAKRMKWVEPLRGLFLERVKTRTPLSPHAVAYAAHAKDPASYPDLSWHFVHTHWGHETMLRELEQCEGFDLDDAVRKAWTRARLDINSKSGLIIPAAQRGLPDALGAAANYISEQEEDQQMKIGERIQSFIDHPELEEPFVEWFLNNLDQLAYDAERGRYRMR